MKRTLLLLALVFATCKAAPATPPTDEVERANFEWRIEGKTDAAIARLKAIGGVDAQLELARIAAKRKDWTAALATVDAALPMAKTNRERRKIAGARAFCVVEGRRAAELPATIAALRDLIKVEGPMIEAAGLLARAGILANDGVAALEGIDGYYHVSQFSKPPALIADAHAVLARKLPSWNGAADDELIGALAGVRFFEEAALVAQRANPPSVLGKEIIDYAAALQRIRDGVDEYYRRMARGESTRERELRNLVKLDPRLTAVGNRYGLYVNIGETGNHVDLHMAHRVVDSTLAVQQYGRRANVRFIALDGIVSNGYSQWLNDGRSGDGGWGTAKEIYQVRPLYANGPLRDWLRVTDPEVRAESEKKTDEGARMRRQYLDATYAAVPTRDAFLSRIEKDTMQYSIVMHEGRHAIDQAAGSFKTWELEYRAKLSQIALADAPRASLASVLSDGSPDDSPHGKANRKLIAEFKAAAHTDDLTTLTDEQIRAVAKGLDPLAK